MKLYILSNITFYQNNYLFGSVLLFEFFFCIISLKLLNTLMKYIFNVIIKKNIARRFFLV